VLILAVLGLMASVSTFVAIKEALVTGTDFQWSGAHLLAQHQDPWKIFLAGDPGRQIIIGQEPNYLAEFFLLLGPLGRMPFREALAWWCGLNMFFLSGVLYLMRKMFHLDRDHMLLVTFLVLSATPFRVTMSNGQHGIFVLLMLCIVFYAGNRLTRGAALGLSYSKYSFSPLMVMVLLLERQFGVFLISLAPPIAGLLVAQRMLGGSLKTLAFEPIATSKLAVGLGLGDVMTLLDIAISHGGFPRPLVFSVVGILGLICALAAAIWIWRDQRLDERMRFAVAIIMTLLCFKHLEYDFVVLVVPVAAAAMAPKSKARTVVMLCMA
jgi:hypothetical protein